MLHQFTGTRFTDINLLVTISHPFNIQCCTFLSLTAMTRTFTLASRASQLAQIQTNIVLDACKQLLSSHNEESKPSFKTSFMATGGDKNQSQALYLLGGKALWTKELEVALKEKDVDMLVHSLKDVPTALPEGCIIGAVLQREDPVDSLVVKRGEIWRSLEDLPSGSVVGTSSVRRVAQLKRRYPYLKFLDVVSLIYSSFFAAKFR
jgi:hydroxymethylbilane synthase